jgi:hypothetical protein
MPVRIVDDEELFLNTYPAHYRSPTERAARLEGMPPEPRK